MDEQRQEIVELTPNTKGIIYVKRLIKEELRFDWILLISSISEEGNLYRYASYNIDLDKFFLDITGTMFWGYVKNRTDIKFYYATEEEKNIIKEKLKENGYKYIKIMNKIIKR